MKRRSKRDDWNGAYTGPDPAQTRCPGCSKLVAELALSVCFCHGHEIRFCSDLCNAAYHADHPPVDHGPKEKTHG